jgi:hypothetical protein
VEHFTRQRLSNRKPMLTGHDDVDFPFNDDLGFLDAGIITRRASDKLPGVGADLQTLDTLMDRHGLRAVLKSLRDLCDGRANGEGTDMDATFADMERSDQWKLRGTALEELVMDTRVKP